MFFDGWESIWRIVVVATAAYVIALVALRLFGETALAKMSAYDLIVTVALGSILANIALSTDVSVTDGAAVIVTYLLAQHLTRYAIKRSARVRRIVKDDPHLVLWDGQLLKDRLDAKQLMESEVRAAVRRAGLGSLGDAQAVVLENDGQWSVISRGQAGDLSAFAGLDLPDWADVDGDALRARQRSRRSAQPNAGVRP